MPPLRSARPAMLLVACCAFGVLGVFSCNRHWAASDARSRLLALERQLQVEREARASGSGSWSCASTRIADAKALSSLAEGSVTVSSAALRAAAIAELRIALLQASQNLASALSPSIEELAAGELEHARFELREALASEDPGWCSCPPPPNITRLCMALVPTLSEASTAPAELESLRAAVLEANARAADANERATQLSMRLQQKRASPQLR